MKRYSVYVTPVCDGGSKLMADVDLVHFAVVVDGGTFSRSFDSWAKLRMELLRAKVLSPAYLTHAEDNFGELSPFSLSTFPMRGLRVLRLMKKKAGWTEYAVAEAACFRVRMTHRTTTVKALRAGSS
jgi:hypothetical protein